MKKKEKQIKFYTEKSEQKSLKSEINDKYQHKVEFQNLMTRIKKNLI